MTITVSDIHSGRRVPPAVAPVIARIADMRSAVAAARVQGARIALVPTMGALHEGHLRLLDVARAEADFVVMSVFVNPLQFGAGEDLAKYPRDTAGDVAKARGRGVDAVFAPTVEEMYPYAARHTRVVPVGLDEHWEGAVRPGHFAGVLTVVAKLFNIVGPDVAVFGQKDAQQAAIVRAMVRDLDFPVRLVIMPTVREPDGLALSSRNVFLSPEERQRALGLSGALTAVVRAFENGEHRREQLEATGRSALAAESIEPDYFAIVDPDSLQPVPVAAAGTLVLVAARIGNTRLIDNTILGAQ